jgi:queuosine precursor transporter
MNERHLARATSPYCLCHFLNLHCSPLKGTHGFGSTAVPAPSHAAPERGTLLIVITRQTNSTSMLTILVSVYIAAIIVSNATAGRLVEIGSFVFPGAIFLFALTFTLRDAIHVVGGWPVAKSLIVAGFVANALLAGYGLAVIYLPAPTWFDGSAYEAVFGMTARVVVASLAAFGVAAFLDAYVFERLKRSIVGRVVTSNVASTSADTVIFILIAFAGTGAPLLNLMLGQIVIKMAVSSLMIPLVVSVRNTLRSRGLALEGY